MFRIPWPFERTSRQRHSAHGQVNRKLARNNKSWELLSTESKRVSVKSTLYHSSAILTGQTVEVATALEKYLSKQEQLLLSMLLPTDARWQNAFTDS